MANISTYIAQIESASRGEQVRDSIIKALQAINNAVELGGGGSGSGGSLDNVGLLEVFETGKIGTADIYDSTPIQNSPKAVTSGGLWILLGNIGALLDNLNGEVIS